MYREGSLESPFATIPTWAEAFFQPGRTGRGLIKHLPAELYHNTPGLISNSALKDFAKAPRYLRYRIDNPRPLTRDLIIGDGFHAYTLERPLFDSRYCIVPEFGRSTARTQALTAAWIENEGEGKHPISKAQLAIIQAMRESVMADSYARKIIESALCEITAVWTDPETGLRCKARADGVSEKYHCGMDLKSTKDASEDGFARTVGNFRYNVQDPFYTRQFEDNGLDINHFVFIACEKEPPYLTGVYQLDETARLKGESLYMRELRLLKQCIEKDYWPSYTDGIVDLSLPVYFTRDIDLED